MIGYVMVGTNDLAQESRFHELVLKPLALIRFNSNPDYVAYALHTVPEAIEFCVTLPFDQQPAHYGNWSMIAFSAESRATVDHFHQIGLYTGGSNEGKIGSRPPDGLSTINMCAIATATKYVFSIMAATLERTFP